jgi:hypothetical protein
MTTAATKAFQQAWNDNEVLPEGTSRVQGDLDVDGKFGDQTRAALREGYVGLVEANVDESRFMAPKLAGCVSFNQLGRTDAENRRVVVAFFGGEKPAPTNFPCKDGDFHACTVDDKAPMRCKFYRKHVRETPAPPPIPFFDFEWIRNGKVVHLSALSTLPEGKATFTVYKVDAHKLPKTSPDSSNGQPKPDGQVIAKVDGKIVGGIAFAQWTPEGDYDPFDHHTWLVDHDTEDGETSIDELLARSTFEPPLFCIESGGKWAYSKMPGKPLNRIRLHGKDDASGVALTGDGRIVEFKASGGKIDAKDDVIVLSLLLKDGYDLGQPHESSDGSSDDGAGGDDA